MVELININSNYPAHNGVIMLCLLEMDEYRSELRAALEDLIVLLQESSSGGNRELCCVRLEILAENAEFR